MVLNAQMLQKVGHYWAYWAAIKCFIILDYQPYLSSFPMMMHACLLDGAAIDPACMPACWMGPPMMPAGLMGPPKFNRIASLAFPSGFLTQSS